MEKELDWTSFAILRIANLFLFFHRDSPSSNIEKDFQIYFSQLHFYRMQYIFIIDNYTTAFKRLLKSIFIIESNSATWVEN